MARILVLQHADWELPGLYGDVLTDRRAQVRVVRPDHDEPLPDPHRFDAVLAMGGPMSVNDEARLPWLGPEKRLIAAAVDADLPYFGVCLGAQLLASALGARVHPGPRPEYGMHRVEATAASADDPVFGGFPREVDVFQWHGETFDLPRDGVPLVSSAGYPHQAVRVGARAYGVQFHLEVSLDLLAKWLAVPQCMDEARHALGPDAEATLTAQLQAAEADMLTLARDLFTGWLRLVGD